MQIKWSEKSVRWFAEASEYTGYNRKLAEMLLKYIPLRSTLCDLGCGAGLIDYELAKCVENVTCVDISGEAVQAVLRGAAERGIENIAAVCADAKNLSGTWETVIAMFFGGDKVFENCFHLASDTFIMATHGSAEGTIAPEGHRIRKRSDVCSVKAELDRLGVKYRFEEAAIEYGQPFRSMADAAEFVKAYSTPMTDDEMAAYIDARLVETGDGEYPFYMPNKKKFGLFVIRRDENENI